MTRDAGKVSYEFPRPICGVDVVVLTLDRIEGAGPLVLHTLLVRRALAPFQGEPALPGAHVHTDTDESLEATARRLLASKCGIYDNGRRVHIDQLATWGDDRRDPRDWSITVGYVALVPRSQIPERPDTLLRPVHAHGETDGARQAGVEGLPFDHDAILATAVERLRGRATYTSVPTRMMASTFTLPELHEAYEATTRRAIDKAWFRKVMLEMEIADNASSSAAVSKPSADSRTGKDVSAKKKPFLVQKGQVATSTRPAQAYGLATNEIVAFRQRF